MKAQLDINSESSELGKMKAMLVRSKVELDDAYKKISYLRDELQLQQRYFDE